MFLRIISFIFRNIRNLTYVFRYAYAYSHKNFPNNAKFLSDKELVEELRKGKSLLRLGDGEIYMMNYGSIPQYEPYNPRLRKYFFEIVKSYTEKSPYIIGIPIFVNSSNQELEKIGKLHVWLPLKILFRFIFPHNVSYFDAHLFYRNNGFNRSLANVLDGYKILVVTRNHNIQLIQEALSNKFQVEFIETPERESFKLVNELTKQIQNIVNKDKENYRVILSCGPASKVLVYELSKQGIISYDIGKGIEAIYHPNKLEEQI